MASKQVGIKKTLRECKKCKREKERETKDWNNKGEFMCICVYVCVCEHICLCVCVFGVCERKREIKEGTIVLQYQCLLWNISSVILYI